MLDGLDAAVQGDIDPLVGVHMGRDVSAVPCGLVNGGRDFFGRVLNGVQGIGQAGDAAARADLDLRYLAGQRFATGFAHLGNAVGQDEKPQIRQPEMFPDEILRIGIRVAHVSVAGGLGQAHTAGENPRSPGQPLVNGLLQAERRATDIAHGCESAHQVPFRFGGHHRTDVVPSAKVQEFRRRSAHCQVGVYVTETRHQCSAAAVDHGVVWRFVAA